MMHSIGQFVVITQHNWDLCGVIGVIVEQHEIEDGQPIWYTISTVKHGDMHMTDRRFTVLQKDALEPENIPTRRKTIPLWNNLSYPKGGDGWD
jgi:hypothetical protein